MKCSIKEAHFKELFFFVFVFKSIAHVLTHYEMHYPCLKFRKKFINSENVNKSCENVSFCFCTEKKDVAKTYLRSIRSSGVGNSVDLHRSKPFISVIPFNLHFHCFQG